MTEQTRQMSVWTVAGGIGAIVGAAIAAGTLVWADGSTSARMQTTQQANTNILTDHEARLRSVESARARDDERWNRLEKDMDKIQQALGVWDGN